MARHHESGLGLTGQWLLAAAMSLLAGLVGAAQARSLATRPPIVVGDLTLTPCQDQYAGYCGSFERPLDPTGRLPGSLSIGFEWYPRTDATLPSLGTMSAQEGGPGYSTTGSRDGYVRMLSPLRDRRDILLMDKRGTGKSGAIICPTLQGSAPPSVADYTECGARLGQAAWLYGTTFASDDLAALLDRLGVGKIDYYGDSYGTFVGQVFAVRHPDRLRTLVLDSAYPARGQTPWFNTEYATAPRALEIVCRRTPSCLRLGGDPVERMHRLVRALRSAPLVGHAPDQDGTIRPVTANPANLFLLLDFAGNSPIVWRDFDAAARAYLDAGDGLPLLRLVAESFYGNALGGNGAGEFSVGLAASVQCSDYAEPFDYAGDGPRRRAQFAAAFAAEAAIRPLVYDPFTLEEVLSAPYQPIPLQTCIGWPAPPAGIAPGRPTGARPFPDLPVLVMNGELDTITSPHEGRRTARFFPWARFVLVDNAIHETAIGDGGVFVPPFGGDLAHCAQPIVLRFIASGGDPGDTSCAQHTRAIRAVPAFARLTADIEPAATLRAGTPDSALRAASAAAEAVGDVIARYFQSQAGTGAGLRGGRFALSPNSRGYAFGLDGVRFTEDLAVSGTIDWDQVQGAILARVRLSGAASGELSITWDDLAEHASCLIEGAIDGQPVSATRAAP